MTQALKTGNFHTFDLFYFMLFYAQNLILVYYFYFLMLKFAQNSTIFDTFKKFQFFLFIFNYFSYLSFHKHTTLGLNK